MFVNLCNFDMRTVEGSTEENRENFFLTLNSCFERERLEGVHWFPDTTESKAKELTKTFARWSYFRVGG